jgi:hypothetical protein
MAVPMKPTHVVLHEYAGDAWHGRIVDGDAIGEVERWLAAIEARPREAPASGKPLAWLYLGTLTDNRLRATRSVGLLTDVRRALDRGLRAGELEALISIFDHHGRPFDGDIDRT